MTTRGARLAPEHVRALNQIDLEYHGTGNIAARARPSAADKAVIEAWRSYADTLSEDVRSMPDQQYAVWSSRSEDRFVALLYALSRQLGYRFDETDLRRGAYWPDGHWQAERRQNFILDQLAAVLAGRQTVGLDVRSFPGPDDATAEQQKKLGDRLLKALAADGALKIEVKNGKLAE